MPIALFADRHLSGVQTLLRDALHADPSAAPQFVGKVLLDINFRAEGTPVWEEDGQVHGMALGIVRRAPLEDAASDTGACYLTLLAVEPSFRRSGIGTALVQHIEQFARDHGADRVLVSPYAPNYFTPGVDISAYPEALRLFVRMGYEVVYRPISMERSLTRCVAPDWVAARGLALREEGITVEPYHPERTLALLEFLRREFPGDWQRCAREAMHRAVSGHAPSTLHLAIHGQEVLGFSHHLGERIGPIGVAREAQGRGIGQALLWSTMEAMRAAGLRLAWFLWSDDSTAKRFYEPAGFVVTRRFAVLRKRL